MLGATSLLAVGSVLLSVVWLPWGEDRFRVVTGGEFISSTLAEFVVSVAAVAVGLGAGYALWRRRCLVAPWSGRHVAGIADWFGVPTLTRVGIVDPVLALSHVAERFDDRVVDAGARSVARFGAVVSTGLARFDDRVVDAGARGVAGIAKVTSRTLAHVDDRGVDEGVRGVAWLTRRSARMFDRVGEFGIDGAMDGAAHLTGLAGRASRRLQTGLTHQYYAAIAAASMVLVVVLAVWR